MADLRTQQRKSMPRALFAYVDANGEGHLPLNDEGHVRNAMSRWGQTAFPSVTAKENARRKILRAARRRGIAVSREDKVARRTRGLSPARATQRRVAAG